MEMKLAGNIRHFRKHRGMTQEQLAEVLGVTIGAVHKWETGMSTPELGLIAEMADFFDVSMDILVGYEMKDNRLATVTDRLSRYINEEDPEGLNEAEKALSRFPHSFEIVYLSAALYMIIGGKNHDDSQLSRASELLEIAMVLLPQSGSEKLSEITIYEMMSNVRMMQGHGDQAAELLKKHNRDGIYNDQIGLLLSLFCKQPKEAQPYLSKALLGAVSQLISTVIGKAYAFTVSGNPDAAEDLLLWGMRTLEGLKQREMTGHVDQSCGYLCVLLAYVCLKKGKASEAGDAARRALKLAKRFDASPNYDARSYRFIDDAENASLHFIMGRTASESMAFFVRLIADKQLTALWERTIENEHEKD